MFDKFIDPNFDPDKEEKRKPVIWALYGAAILCVIYLFTGRPFATEICQGLFATILPYGSSFYVNLKGNLNRAGFWKALLATLPVHALYISGIVYSDRAFPEVMTKAVVFIPVLTVGFGIESALIFDRIIAYFARQRTDHPLPPMNDI